MTDIDPDIPECPHLCYPREKVQTQFPPVGCYHKIIFLYLQTCLCMAELQSTKRVIRSHSLNSVKTTRTIEDLNDLSGFAFQSAVFYLDLPKNNVNVKKITTILQGLGAKIEKYFNSSTVTHVLTSRKVEQETNLSNVLFQYTQSPRRKRVEKLLTTASKQEEEIEDVMTLAMKLGKTIYHVNKFIPVLNKLIRKKVTDLQDSSKLSRQLANPYLMVEDTSGQCKPLLKEFIPDKQNNSTVPRLNLDIPVPLLSPFFGTEEAKVIWRKKEERAKIQVQPNGVGFVTKKDGLCEACNVKFSDLEQHRTTEKHRDFGTNVQNWAEIDAILQEINRENNVLL